MDALEGTYIFISFPGRHSIAIPTGLIRHGAIKQCISNHENSTGAQ